MNAASIVALLASGVAIATSIGSMVVALAALRRDRSHLRVDTSFAFFTPNFDTQYVLLTVVNDGRYPETVTSVGIFTRDEKQAVWVQFDAAPDGHPPWLLEPNDSRSGYMVLANLQHQWARDQLRPADFAFARTKSGKTYKSGMNVNVRAKLSGH